MLDILTTLIVLVSPLLAEGSDDVAIPADTITVSPSSTKPACSDTTNACSIILSVETSVAVFKGLTPQYICIFLRTLSYGEQPIISAFGLSLDVSLAVKPEIVGHTIALALRFSAVWTVALHTALDMLLLL